MKRTVRRGLISAVGLVALGLVGCGPAEEGSESLIDVTPSTSGAALTAQEQAAVHTAHFSEHCGSLNDFHWELGTGSTVLFSISRGGSVGATTEMQLASATKWLYASAYLQSKGGYLHLTPDDKKRLNFTSGFLDAQNTLCDAPGVSVSTCYGPSYKNVAYQAAEDGRFHYDGGHMQKLALDDIGARRGTGMLSVMDWVNGWLGTSLPEADSAVAVAGGFRGSAAQYRLFLQKLLTHQYAMSNQLTADAVPAYSGGPGVSSTPWTSGQQVFYGLGNWLERDLVNGAWTLTGHSSPGAFGFYPWVSADKSQYMILARYRLRLFTSEPEQSRACAQAIRTAYLTGVAQP